MTLQAISLLIEQQHQVTLVHFDSLQYNPLYPQAAENLTKLGVRVKLRPAQPRAAGTAETWPVLNSTWTT